MTQAELKTILDKHEKWLNDEESGECADLRGADLRYANLRDADLRGADLSCADLSYANLRDANLSRANLSRADLSRADLSYADLSYANLRDANLSDANLDFSCLPLWCGSLHAHFDDRQIIQIVYHAVRAGLGSPNVSDDVKSELRKVAGLANRFHRVDECGRIEEVEGCVSD